MSVNRNIYAVKIYVRRLIYKICKVTKKKNHIKYGMCRIGRQ